MSEMWSTLWSLESGVDEDGGGGQDEDILIQ